MRAAGTWVTPRLNGREFHQKPFLPMAFIRAGYALLGVNEWGARIPSALLGLGTVLLTAAIAQRLFGEAAGIRAGLVLGSSLLFLLISRSSMTDSAFLFFFTLALTAFLLGGSDRVPKIPGLLVMYAAAGLATLCKGPIGFLLPLAIVAIVSWSRSGLASLRRLQPLKGAAVLGLIVVPWYLFSESVRRGHLVGDFWLRENVGRFLSPMERHGGPFWIYLPVLVVAFLPWSPFVPGAWVAVPDRLSRWILGAWIAVPFVFFSAAATKLPHYLLPVFPPLAILVGVGWEKWAISKAWRRLAPLAVLVVLSGSFALAFGIAHRFWPALLPSSLLVTAAVLPAGAALALAVNRRPGAVFGALVGSMTLFAWLACGWSLPGLENVRIIRPVGILLRELKDVPVYSYRFLEPGLLFYSRRTIERLDRPEEITAVAAQPRFAIVAREQEVPGLRRAAGVPLAVVGVRRGFCEDSGPLSLVVLARGLDRP